MQLGFSWSSQPPLSLRWLPALRSPENALTVKIKNSPVVLKIEMGSSDFKYLHLHYHLASSREPLGLLIEEPKVGRPQETVEKAEKNRDVSLSELRAGASAVHLR